MLNTRIAQRKRAIPYSTMKNNDRKIIECRNNTHQGAPRTGKQTCVCTLELSDASHATCKRLEAYEMWIWRRMLKISRTEHKTNDEVLQRVEEQRTLTTTVRQKTEKWLGHVLHHNSHLPHFQTRCQYGLSRAVCRILLRRGLKIRGGERRGLKSREQGWGSWGAGSQPPPHQLGGLAERCKLPQRGPGGLLHFVDARWLFLSFQRLLGKHQRPHIMEHVIFYTVKKFSCYNFGGGVRTRNPPLKYGPASQ